MRKVVLSVSVLLIVVSFVASCNKEESNDLVYKVYATSGSAAGINNKMNEFRAAMGTTVNLTVSGADPAGRREITWEAVDASLVNQNDFPLNYFAATDGSLPDSRKMGLVIAGTGSVQNFRLDSSSFAGIDASYPAQFTAFSPKRMFANLSGNVTDFTFKVPGSDVEGSVSGMGLVFVDVDDAVGTTVEFFNEYVSLGVFEVPARAAGSPYSFLGVHFLNEEVLQVRVVGGNSPLGPGIHDVSSGLPGATKDVVAFDDIIYSEPLRY